MSVPRPKTKAVRITNDSNQITDGFDFASDWISILEDVCALSVTILEVIIELVMAEK